MQRWKHRLGRPCRPCRYPSACDDTLHVRRHQAKLMSNVRTVMVISSKATLPSDACFFV